MKELLGHDVVVCPRGYDGLGAALTEALGPARRSFLVTDDTVGPLWESAVMAACGAWSPEIVRIPAGEAHKTLDTWRVLVSELIARGVHRDTPLFALGGGVVGDLVGFAAACTLRGLSVVQLPTTLLAMVDASVGGKTGVNHPRGKNLVGAFHRPSLVWAALPTLQTLPEREVRAGWGEVIKTALVGDAGLFDALVDSTPSMEEVVARCVAVKARVVAADEREGGVRAILNAGHTVGHAVETALGHGAVAHGEAVAIGLVAEARYAVRAGVCEVSELPDRIAAAVRKMGLRTEVPGGIGERLLQAVTVDKKGSTDTLTVPLPVRLGVYKRVRLPWAEAPLLLNLVDQ